MSHFLTDGLSLKPWKFIMMSRTKSMPFFCALA